MQPKYSINDNVIAKTPICSCKGGGFAESQAIILKVIPTPNGIWYYLSNQSTINETNIIRKI